MKNLLKGAARYISAAATDECTSKPRAVRQTRRPSRVTRRHARGASYRVELDARVRRKPIAIRSSPSSSALRCSRFASAAAPLDVGEVLLGAAMVLQRACAMRPVAPAPSARYSPPVQ